MNKKVLNKPIATDDQGNEVYLCQFSKKPVSINHAVMLGPLMANVSGTFVCHQDGKEARKQSKICFDENEANCNTCKNLMRVHHDKIKGGFLEGVCQKNKERIRFHPDDWMGKECWEAR
jgi:hypothetical protein